MLLLIDNYDSFTYNLVQYLRELQHEVVVFTNDSISIDSIKKMQPHAIVLSPGPGRPEHAGICLPVIKEFAGKIPIFGVCLGHQAIAQAFGANIVTAQHIMHGKTSKIRHQGNGLFQNIPSDFVATRYHSLVVDQTTLPNSFGVTAWALDGNNSATEIMAIQHRHWPLYGVQFHPEAILTEHGHALLENFFISQ